MIFRGKRKDNGEIVTGYYFHLYNVAMRGDTISEGDWEYEAHDIFGIFDDSGLTNPVDWEGTIHRASYVEVIPESLAMETGVKDKNSKMIFGSIVVDGKMSEGGDDVRGKDDSGLIVTTRVHYSEARFFPLSEGEFFWSDIEIIEKM